ncbi:TonB-dependent siderophore receptor [Alcanivorax sp. DP30]|uniref:TonB-dependent receptor plug domain-containing protein n=1 Tax=Alcanivorax sp. DP30 TaxID=2606217 RepID=UPI001369BE7F|nr:TonB-dependent receptor [Alcanivorax sp. DP30]MZR63797.1 TonB-dependent receptor [Alcanivorax sp. DP30]
MMPLDGNSTMVLTPARVSQPQSEAPASVTVIDRNLIEASGARELYEVLKLVPGMSAVKVDGNVPTVAYHGTQARDTRRMLVLLDGRSQYQPGLSRVNWNDMPVDIQDVERIEVTRGPAAAAYGANAFTAVINIITRDPRDISGNSISIAAGNNAIRDGRAAAAGQSEDMAWRASVARRADDGYDEPLEGSKLPDAKRIETLNSEWLWTADEKNTFAIQAGGSTSRLERLQDGGAASLGEYRQDPVQKGERAFLQLEWQHAFSQTHQLKLTGYGQYNNEVTDFKVCYFDPVTGQIGPGGGLFFSRELRDLFLANNGDIDATLGAALSNPAVLSRYGALAGLNEDFCAVNELDIQEERYDLEVQDTLQITDRLRLVSGLNVRQDRAISQTYLSGTEENLSYRAFGNLSAEVIRNVLVNLGGYWEHDEISGKHFSPRAGVNWRFLPGHSLRYVYSEAVRTPDIYEERAHTNIRAYEMRQPFASDANGLLGWSPAYFFVTRTSPGTLEPEEIRSWEVGYFGQLRMLDLDVRYFQETLTNLLSHALNPFEFEPNNEGEVFHQGTEAQLTWRPSVNHLVRGTGAHIHTRTNKKTEGRLAARDSASLLWAWQLTDNWGFSTAYYLFDAYNDNVFERVDAQLRFRHQLAGSEVEWKAVVQHALNKAPLVFEENRYAEDRMWLGMSVRF